MSQVRFNFAARLAPAAALAVLLAAGAARAQAAGEALSVDTGKSSATYRLVHKLHKFDGVSKSVEGKARLLPDGKAQVMLRAPVASFDSGNANRDAHMQETVEAARFPTVEIKLVGEGVALPAEGAAVEKTFRGEVVFHGVKQPVSVPVKLEGVAGGRVRATTNFTLSLDACKVERPSLLFVKIDDAMEILAEVVFKK